MMNEMKDTLYGIILPEGAVMDLDEDGEPYEVGLEVAMTKEQFNKRKHFWEQKGYNLVRDRVTEDEMNESNKICNFWKVYKAVKP